MSKLVNESLPRTIAKMAIPMLAGTFALNAYMLTNAWFVSRLGTEALAAISFAGPVVMLVMFLTRGLSSGAMTLTAHAIGATDHKQAAALTTHALLLTAVYGLLVSAVGLATIRAVFAKLGASGDVLEVTVRYMTVWCLGAVVMALQIVAADLIISTGATAVVSLLMVAGTLLNVFFDYALIFGKLGFPAIGVAGAALATILVQGATLAAALWLLARRLRLLDCRQALALGAMLRSWRRILRFAVPGALGMILTPISAAFITRLVADYGNAAVAATGVAGRIEMFAFMIPMTVGMSLIPLVAQNFGAGELRRVRRARLGTMSFAAAYGLFIAAVFMIFAERMAWLFSTEREVVDVLTLYIRVTCLGYGMLEVNRYAGFVMIGVHEPLRASLLNVIRVVALLFPLALAGSALFQLKGVFYGRLATDLLAGSIGVWWSNRVLSAKARALSRDAADSPGGG